MIGFNYPPRIPNSIKYITDIFDNRNSRGNGYYTLKCSEWLEKNFNIEKVLLTGSCTHSLEMAALLMDIREGDEVIMPSFTFCSTANAFALRGAKIVFVDVRPDTMNIDENLIEAAITDKTRAIVPVHYAGVSCEMDKIIDIARKYNLYVVEDAAQGVMATYKGKYLGTIGDFGTYSFHETKNYSMGEGGAICINNSKYIERAEIIREKGTNRSLFLRGQVDKYTWVDIGSSYLPSDISAANLFGQLEIANTINQDRLKSWDLYYSLLSDIASDGLIELPFVPKYCVHNGHIFYIKVKDIQERTDLIKFLKERGIIALFHYVPLHSSTAGKKYCRFFNDDVYTTKESNRLVRLPMYYGLKQEDVSLVVQEIKNFFAKKIILKKVYN